MKNGWLRRRWLDFRFGHSIYLIFALSFINFILIFHRLLIERIESALLSYGNDFDNRDNPFEANFDKFVNLESDVNFLGKERLKQIKQNGIKRKLMGVKIDHNKIDMYCEKTLYDDNNNIVGHVRSAAYSPTFKKVIGIAMINKPY